MDEQIPRQTRVVRKSAFGRTSLFLPSTNTILREVKCMGGITRLDGVSVFHMHKIDENPNVLCWHCCEEFEGKGFPLPRLYDPVENVYHVYGRFCSPGCCKAYVLEHVTFDRGQHMNVLVKMLREVYGIRNFVVEAPPRISLKKFGGMFDIKQFREMQNVCSIIQPPFVSYCMVVEERLPQQNIGEIIAQPMHIDNREEDDITQQQTDGLYTDYVNNKGGLLSSTTVASNTKKRKEPPSTSSNSLARYAKNA